MIFKPLDWKLFDQIIICFEVTLCLKLTIWSSLPKMFSSWFACFLLVPGPPSNVSFPDVTTTTARIIWDVPQEPNGEILGYKISFWRRPGSSLGSDAEDEESSENADRGRVSREVSAMDRTLKAFDLQPQSYYEFAVSARTQEGWGMEARALVLTTASREKPQAPSRPLVSPSQVQARHVTLSWTPGRDGFAPLRCYLLQQVRTGLFICLEFALA